jgi:hypothetical protein
MEQHLGAKALARFPLANPSWESPAISREPFNVLLHVGEKGHTCYSVMAPEKRLPAWSSMSLCVVIDQPVGNPKRKV